MNTSQIGQVRVRADPPSAESHKLRKVHGHASCYSLVPDDNKENAEWDIGGDCFVSFEGRPLKSFAKAAHYHVTHHTDVFIRFETLKKLHGTNIEVASPSSRVLEQKDDVILDGRILPDLTASVTLDS